MQNARPQVSVLVPIYNVEKYLPQCLEALCGQTLRDMEIIAINDGSTDGSADILRSWAKKDSRITILDKPNSGYGASMNQGLDAAHGEYIGIVEPDDFPEKTMFKKLFRVAQRHNCDLVKCNYFEHFETGDRLNLNLRAHPYNKVFDPVDRPSIVCSIPSIWTGLYRKDMLDSEHIRFRETPGASFQDTSFVMKVWFAARRCVLVRKPLLHYRMDNSGSSVKTSDKIFSVCDELAECEQFLRLRPDKYAVLMPWFLVDKWGKYRWNYERINAESHCEFAECMRMEYRTALDAKELDLSLFDDRARPVVEELLASDAATFAAAHTETF